MLHRSRRIGIRRWIRQRGRWRGEDGRRVRWWVKVRRRSANMGGWWRRTLAGLRTTHLQFVQRCTDQASGGGTGQSTTDHSGSAALSLADVIAYHRAYSTASNGTDCPARDVTGSRATAGCTGYRQQAYENDSP